MSPSPHRRREVRRAGSLSVVARAEPAACRFGFEIGQESEGFFDLGGDNWEIPFDMPWRGAYKTIGKATLGETTPDSASSASARMARRVIMNRKRIPRSLLDGLLLRPGNGV